MSKKFDAKSTADEVLAGIDLKGKRFLVTSTSAGIGVEAARALVSRGAIVVGAVRKLAKAETATASVRNAASAAGGSFDLIELDLASLQSVRAGADKLLVDGLPFDAIIANAGVMATPFGRTVDGFEVQFATNYLAAEFDGRHRDRGIRAAAAMPGNSLTELPRNFSQEQLQGLFETVGKARTQAGLPPGELKTLVEAAATSVWAAVVADADEIGGRYLEDCAVAPVNESPNPFADGVRSYALDAGKAKQLWAKSVDMVGTQ